MRQSTFRKSYANELERWAGADKNERLRNQETNMTGLVSDSASKFSLDNVLRAWGGLLDWKINAILEIDASIGYLEAAVAWLEGEDDIMGEERRPGR
ncbi:MAG: hypothetical protein EHM80_14745 [Nitrospiraceae bacterium]|nr:MAG: hypothetical protein EHM80_14745 [Nitrospiraceae bacterium]